MATAQQKPVAFNAKEAERFAVLWAGWDTGNPSEAEAMAKGRAMRRMTVAKNLRIIDALELPEIRQALADQMEPVRMPGPDIAALQAEIEDLRDRLENDDAEDTRLAEALSREMELTAQLNALLQGSQRNRSIAGPGLSIVLALALAVECAMLIVGSIGDRQTAPRPAPATRVAPPFSVAAIEPQTKPIIPKATVTRKREVRPQTRPKAKPPVPESSF